MQHQHHFSHTLYHLQTIHYATIYRYLDFGFILLVHDGVLPALPRLEEFPWTDEHARKLQGAGGKRGP